MFLIKLTFKSSHEQRLGSSVGERYPCTWRGMVWHQGALASRCVYVCRMCAPGARSEYITEAMPSHMKPSPVHANDPRDRSRRDEPLTPLPKNIKAPPFRWHLLHGLQEALEAKDGPPCAQQTQALPASPPPSTPDLARGDCLEINLSQQASLRAIRHW